MKKETLLIILAAVLALVLAGLVVAVQFLPKPGTVPQLQPQKEAGCAMDPAGSIEMQDLENGYVLLSWPAGENADSYLVEIRDGAGTTLHSAYAEGKTSCVIPAFSQEEALTVCIHAIRVYSAEDMRMGETALEVTGIFRSPVLTGFAWNADTESNAFSLSFALTDGGSSLLYRVLDNGEMTQQTGFDGTLGVVSFGEGKDFPIPEGEEQITLALKPVVYGQRYTYYGLLSDSIQVTARDFLGTDLHLDCTENSQNSYTFTWNEARGNYYELQQMSGNNYSWETVCRIESGEPRTFTTETLDNYTDFLFRVVSYGQPCLPDSELTAASNIVQIAADTSAVYCTIWPQRDLEVYSDAQRTTVLGTTYGATAYCVLGIEDGMFRVKYGDDFGYLDSNYCMINLTEFLGSLCSYDIVNSYSALYMAHGYELPTVTGKVIVGYDKVKLSASNYLVPLLYPTALKLEKAALAAIENNYRLKIYDAYRPAEATYALYDQAIGVSNELLPAYTYDGRLGKFSGLTYAQLMTNYGKYSMRAFLAKGGSRHNQGLALDLTLEDLNEGKELSMQTAMHDLSWYSLTSRNNANSKALAKIMTDAGFDILTSEWWHFQDDDSRDELEIDTYLWNGVSPECWMADDTGWRYRTADGSYYINHTANIAGVDYTFDEYGYLVE